MRLLCYLLAASALILIGIATILAVWEFRLWHQRQRRASGRLLVKEIRARLEIAQV